LLLLQALHCMLRLTRLSRAKLRPLLLLLVRCRRATATSRSRAVLLLRAKHISCAPERTAATNSSGGWLLQAGWLLLLLLLRVRPRLLPWSSCKLHWRSSMPAA
jgi:hypothetical protein